MRFDEGADALVRDHIRSLFCAGLTYCADSYDLRMKRRQDDIAVALVGALCIAYGYFVEPYWPEVTRVRLTSPKIPPGSRPVRIALISDLHCDPKPRLEERLPDLIAAEHPDVVLFAGDSINSSEGLPILKRCLGRIAPIAPTFVVRGNWDVGYWDAVDLFGGTGVRELRGDGAEVKVDAATLWITGAAVTNARAAEDELAAGPRRRNREGVFHAFRNPSGRTTGRLVHLRVVPRKPAFGRLAHRILVFQRNCRQIRQAAGGVWRSQ